MSDAAEIREQSIGSKLRKAARQIPHLIRAIGLLRDAAPSLSKAWVALLVLQGLLPIATVYLIRNLVNQLVPAFRARGDLTELRPAIISAALIALVLLATELLKSATTFVRTSLSALVQDYITGLVHRQSLAADLAFYDSPDFYDHLHRAREEATYRPTMLIESLGSVLQNAITLLAMAGVIAQFGFWPISMLIIGTLPAFYVVMSSAMRQHRWHIANTKNERKSWYYDWLLVARETAAELRLFALGAYFQTAHRHLRERLRNERLQLTKRQSLAEFAAAIFALSAGAVAVGWMGWKAIRGLISPGDLAMFYQAFQQGLGLMSALLSNVGQIYASSLFLGGLFEFLALKPAIMDGCSPVTVSGKTAAHIRFRNVSFRYPGTEHLALQDFSMEIHPGSITAIVGHNGAGKSTLLKLLCRLYDPDSGSIELNGVDLRQFRVEALRQAITVLFQQPVHYNATAEQNIAFGNLEVATPELVANAARSAGADEIISSLPHGFDQLLGRWFENGAELSVGEWQRIALARAFLRQAPLLILDEPTSAMDPWAEADWLSRFRRLAAGRTVVLITHRFTTARIADHIEVMADGRIVESGSHSELLTQNGQYAAAQF